VYWGTVGELEGGRCHATVLKRSDMRRKRICRLGYRTDDAGDMGGEGESAMNFVCPNGHEDLTSSGKRRINLSPAPTTSKLTRATSG